MIDTSALLAIFNRETEAADFSTLIEDAEDPCISAAAYLEAGMVLGRPAHGLLEEFLADGHITVVPVDLDHAKLALQAHERFGRGSGSKACLNFGDCLVYALATSLDRPLLFKGDDFAHTDVRRAH